jgi:hypothetical protein
MHFASYEEAPPDVQTQVQAQYKGGTEEDDD